MKANVNSRSKVSPLKWACSQFRSTVLTVCASLIVASSRALQALCTVVYKDTRAAAHGDAVFLEFLERLGLLISMSSSPGKSRRSTKYALAKGPLKHDWRFKCLGIMNDLTIGLGLYAMKCTIFALYWLPINNLQTNDCDNTIQALSSL